MPGRLRLLSRDRAAHSSRSTLAASTTQAISRSRSPSEGSAGPRAGGAAPAARGMIARMPDFPPGTPLWVDLASPAPEESLRFYGGLFGWKDRGPGDPSETGGYRIFTLGGRMVAGLVPSQGGGWPPMWTSYVCVADAAASAERVKAAGGEVLAGPMDIVDQGRMAAFRDPSGALLAVWEPRNHRGAEVVNEPGSYCWSELSSRDPDAARDFYGEVFGWRPHVRDMGGSPYTEFQLDGRTVCGMSAAQGDQPSAWAVSFAVEDCDAATARARELGAAVVMEPVSMEPGRFSVLADPQGAVFAVIALAAPPA